MIRLTADFNALSEDGSIAYLGSSFFTLGIVPGTRVILYEPDDFEVEAVIETKTLEDGRVVWNGRLDWSTRRDI